MTRFFTFTILFFSIFLVSSCKSNKEMPETAKTAEETPVRAEVPAAPAKTEIKANTNKLPNQSLSNPNSGTNTSNPTGSKPR
jgi:hypothetical protein